MNAPTSFPGSKSSTESSSAIPSPLDLQPTLLITPLRPVVPSGSLDYTVLFGVIDVYMVTVSDVQAFAAGVKVQVVPLDVTGERYLAGYLLSGLGSLGRNSCAEDDAGKQFCNVLKHARFKPRCVNGPKSKVSPSWRQTEQTAIKALGIKAALEDIPKQGGTFYDPDVVDACLRFFAESRFAFSETGG